VRPSLKAIGFIQACTVDKAKPGKIVLRLELLRSQGVVEALADMADRQTAVEVTLASLQSEMLLGEEANAEPGEQG